MKKVLSIVTAAIMLALMSFSSFAYDNEYITVNCPENFEESTFFSENPDDVAAVALEEYATYEDGNEYYTGNYINIWMTENINDAVISDFNNQDYRDTTAEYVVEACTDIGETCEITSKDIILSEFMNTETVICSVYYTAKGAAEDGTEYAYNGLTTYIVYLYGEYYITVCADAIDDLDDGVEVNLKNESDRLLETAVSSLTFKVSSSEELLAQQDAEADEAFKAMAPMFIMVGVIWLVMITVFIVVIVLVARSCKKVRKAREQYFAQFANPSAQNYNRGEDMR